MCFKSAYECCKSVLHSQEMEGLKNWPQIIIIPYLATLFTLLHQKKNPKTLTWAPKMTSIHVKREPFQQQSFGYLCHCRKSPHVNNSDEEEEMKMHTLTFLQDKSPVFPLHLFSDPKMQFTCGQQAKMHE